MCSSDLTLQDWLGQQQGDGSTRLVLDPRADQGLSSLAPANQNIVLLVGPEGGFADEEIKAAISAGFTNVRFGQRVLRAETAPVAAIAVIQHLWGDLN